MAQTTTRGGVLAMRRAEPPETSNATPSREDLVRTIDLLGCGGGAWR